MNFKVKSPSDTNALKSDSLGVCSLHIFIKEIKCSDTLTCKSKPPPPP